MCRVSKPKVIRKIEDPSVVIDLAVERWTHRPVVVVLDGRMVFAFRDSG